MTAASKLRSICHPGRRMLAMLAIAVAATPAHAQLQKFNARLTDIQTGLIGLGVVIITIALIWVGYKMAFDHAKWAEVSRVVFAAILAASAPLIAAWVMA